MQFLLLILVLWGVALMMTLKQKAKNKSGLFFYILIIVDIYLAGVLIYFLTSAVFD